MLTQLFGTVTICLVCIAFAVREMVDNASGEPALGGSPLDLDMDILGITHLRNLCTKVLTRSDQTSKYSDLITTKKGKSSVPLWHLCGCLTFNPNEKCFNFPVSSTPLVFDELPKPYNYRTVPTIQVKRTKTSHDSGKDDIDRKEATEDIEFTGSSPINVTVDTGQPIRMNCSVYSSSPVEFKWYFEKHDNENAPWYHVYDGAPVFALNGRLHVDVEEKFLKQITHTNPVRSAEPPLYTSYLTLPDGFDLDTGWYVCLANTSKSMVFRQAYVNVRSQTDAIHWISIYVLLLSMLSFSSTFTVVVVYLHKDIRGGVEWMSQQLTSCGDRNFN